jgi:hypothetical protein
MASLNFTDIADVGSKDRDSGSFLVQVSDRPVKHVVSWTHPWGVSWHW